MEWKSDQTVALSLFFRLYNSYLLRDPALKDNYEMLLEHYNEYPESFKILNRFDLQRLKQIQNDIRMDRYSLFSGTIDFSADIPKDIKASKVSKRHKDLCDDLIDCGGALDEIIGRPVTFRSREHSCAFGVIDILLQDDDYCAYIVEVKADQAKHDIVGQVMKYFVGISLKLNYRLYHDVKVITCAFGYTKEAISGLLQIGAMPTSICSNPLRLKRLDTV